jgi:hypothetical protein
VRTVAGIRTETKPRSNSPNGGLLRTNLPQVQEPYRDQLTVCLDLGSRVRSRVTPGVVDAFVTR